MKVLAKVKARNVRVEKRSTAKKATHCGHLRHCGHLLHCGKLRHCGQSG